METFLIVSYYTRRTNTNPLRVTLKFKHHKTVTIPNTSNHELTAIRVKNIILVPDLLDKRRVLVQCEVEDHLNSHDQYDTFYALTKVGLQYLRTTEKDLVYCVSLKHSLTDELLRPQFEVRLGRTGLSESLSALDKTGHESWKTAFGLDIGWEFEPYQPATEVRRVTMGLVVIDQDAAQLRSVALAEVLRSEWFDTEPVGNLLLQRIVSHEGVLDTEQGRNMLRRVLENKKALVRPFVEFLITPWLLLPGNVQTPDMNILVEYSAGLEAAGQSVIEDSGIKQQLKALMVHKIAETCEKVLRSCSSMLNEWCVGPTNADSPAGRFLGAYIDKQDRRGVQFRRLETIKRAVYQELIKKKLGTSDLPLMHSNRSVVYQNGSNPRPNNRELRIEACNKLVDIGAKNLMITDLRTRETVELENIIKSPTKQYPQDWLYSMNVWVGIHPIRNSSTIEFTFLRARYIQTPENVLPTIKSLSVVLGSMPKQVSTTPAAFVFRKRTVVVIYFLYTQVGFDFYEFDPQFSLKSTVPIVVKDFKIGGVTNGSIQANMLTHSNHLLSAILTSQSIWSKTYDYLNLICRVPNLTTGEFCSIITKQLPIQSKKSSESKTLGIDVPAPMFVEKKSAVYIVHLNSPTEWLLCVFHRNNFQLVQSKAGTDASGLTKLPHPIYAVACGRRSVASRDYFLLESATSTFAPYQQSLVRLSIF